MQLLGTAGVTGPQSNGSCCLLPADITPSFNVFAATPTAQVKAETESEQKINNSYQSLYKQMVEMMRGLGVEAVPTTGAHA